MSHMMLVFHRNHHPCCPNDTIHVFVIMFPTLYRTEQSEFEIQPKRTRLVSVRSPFQTTSEPWTNDYKCYLKKRSSINWISTSLWCKVHGVSVWRQVQSEEIRDMKTFMCSILSHNILPLRYLSTLHGLREYSSTWWAKISIKRLSLLRHSKKPLNEQLI